MSHHPPPADTEGDNLLWLRDLDRGPRLRAYLAAERARYEQTRAAWEPRRQHLRERARSFLPDRAATPPWTVAGRSFHWSWAPGAEYPVLFMQEGPAQRTILHVGALSDTGFIRIGDTAVSPDGRWLAFTVDTLGDEAYDLRLLDLDHEPGTNPPPVILADRAYYGLVWTTDSHHLLSVVHNAADRPYQVWSYAVPSGTRALVLEERDERFHVSLRGTGLPTLAVARAASRCSAEEWLVTLVETPTATSARGRARNVDYTVEPVERDGIPLLVQSRQTDNGYRVTLEERESAQELHVLLDEAPTRRPHSLSAVGDFLVVQGRESGAPTLWVVHMRPPYPETAVVSAEPGTSLSVAAYDSPPGMVCIERTSWTQPTRWEHLHLTEGRVHPGEGTVAELVRASADFLVEQRHVTARDGELIPVTVLRTASTPLDGTAPCLLYGYGAWETVIEPHLEPARLALVHDGVIFAHAHIRGGGERGRTWWTQGRMGTKVTTFHDFIDVAKALGDGVVDPRRIVAQGLSAGGLLMGAVNGMAPDVWAGILAEAPFVDPTTTMADPSQPLVVVERDEWGDPRRDADRAWMSSWAPYLNIPAAAEQPRLLVTSALHDPRVSVWEPARWVAKIEQQGATDRVLFRVDLGARGHWAPPGRWARVDYFCELLAWVADSMDLAPADQQGLES